MRALMRTTEQKRKILRCRVWDAMRELLPSSDHRNTTVVIPFQIETISPVLDAPKIKIPAPETPAIVGLRAAPPSMGQPPAPAQTAQPQSPQHHPRYTPTPPPLAPAIKTSPPAHAATANQSAPRTHAP